MSEPSDQAERARYCSSRDCETALQASHGSGPLALEEWSVCTICYLVARNEATWQPIYLPNDLVALACDCCSRDEPHATWEDYYGEFGGTEEAF